MSPNPTCYPTESEERLTHLDQVHDHQGLLRRNCAAAQDGGEGPPERPDQQQADPPGQPAVADVGAELRLLLELPIAGGGEQNQAGGFENRVRLQQGGPAVLRLGTGCAAPLPAD